MSLSDSLCTLPCTLHIDVRNKDNVTPLHFACVGGNKEIVEYILQKLKVDVGEFVCTLSFQLIG